MKFAAKYDRKRSESRIFQCLVFVLITDLTIAADPTPRPIVQHDTGPALWPQFVHLPDNCGMQSIGVRITGGEKTALDEFPWMALLQYEQASTGEIVSACGGMLINKQYILTAAHCVTGQYLKEFGTLANIRLGEYDTNNATDCVKRQGCSDPPLNLGFDEVIAHAGYDENDARRYNDIALIRLNSTVKFTKFVKPICLLNKNRELPEGSKLQVAGWGVTENHVQSNIKLKLTIPLQSIFTCNETYGHPRVKAYLNADLQICAGGETRKDSCQGDSGGPLMHLDLKDEEGPRWYAAGLVSFGPRPCGQEDIPSIYTKISYHIDWILSNMRE